MMQNQYNNRIEIEILKAKIEAYKDTQTALHDYVNSQLDILEESILEIEEHNQDYGEA